MAEFVRTARDGALLTVTLDRPDVLNALTPALLGELCYALQDAARDDVRAVLLTGAGRGFCAGADLSALPEDTVEGVVDTHYNPVVR